MMNEQLVAYIREQLAAGVTREQITSTVTAQGWAAKDIQEAFNAISPAQAVSKLQFPSSTPATAPKSHIVRWVVSLCVAVLIVGGGMYAYQSFTAWQEQNAAIQQLHEVAQQSSQQTQQILDQVNQLETAQPVTTSAPKPAQTPQTQPKTAPTAYSGPMTTYANASYKFSIAYPADLQLVKPSEGNGRLEISFIPLSNVLIGSNGTAIANDSAQFAMQVSTNGADVKTCLTPAPLASETLSPVTTTNINGVPFTTYTMTSSNKNIIYSWSALLNNTCYYMSIMVIKNLRSSSITAAQTQSADATLAQFVAKLQTIALSFKLNP